MTAGLASILLALAGQDPVFIEYRVGGTEEVPMARIQVQQERLPVPKLSPAKFGDPPMQWMFEWATTSLIDIRGEGRTWPARFILFNQERKEKGDHSVPVARMLTRLWEMNFKEMRLDHQRTYRDGAIEIYLCWGGKAGGEQRYDVDRQFGPGVKVNTIYLYDLRSFTDPVEKAREVAHEYGHAALPPVGGYTEPENWANGYLGEKLYMRYLRDALKAGKFGVEDTMGVEADALSKWVATNVDPLVRQAARSAPDPKRLAATDKVGMDAYIGLAMYIDTLFPRRVFIRSMLLGSQKATDYPEAILSAVEEPEQITLRIPDYLKGEDLWIPKGKAQMFGAKVLQTQGAWVKIRPNGAAPVVLIPKRSNP